MTGDGMCGVFIPDRVLAGQWRSQWPARTLSGINTPHTPYPVALHPPPMKMELIEGSETSAIRTQTPVNCQKEKNITYRTWRKLKIKTFLYCLWYLKLI